MVQVFLRKVCFVLLAAGLVFSGCNKDDGNEPSSLLVGKWHFVKEISDDGSTAGYGQKDDFILFEKNGNFNLSFDGGQEKANGTWEYSSPALKMIFTNQSGKVETEISTVEKLTEDELIYLTDWGMRFYYEKEIVPPDDNAGKNLLVGTWVVTSDKGYEKTTSGNKYSYGYSYEISDNFDKHIFKSDGTFEEYEVDAIILRGDWTYKDEVLTLSGRWNEVNGSEVEYQYNVKKMTSTEMVCEYAQYYTTTAGFFGTKTYTKIK